ncbi:MAG: hypothetical protein ACFFB7_08970 [Candidatus Sifarchaeia archaeon]
MLLKHQIESLLSSIKHMKDYDKAPTTLKLQLVRLFKEATALFGKDVARLTAEPPSPSNHNVVTLRVSAQSLYRYLDLRLGDPVARELVGNEVEMARLSLKQGFLVCAVLMCRVAVEQTMRRLCEHKGIEHPPTAQPSTLAQSLRKENGGPLEKYQWKELDSRLTFEGEVLHSRTKPTEGEVTDLIAWTDKFIDKALT